MGVVFNRHLGVPETMIAGQYTVRTETTRPMLKCPICGHAFDLPAHCRVDHDGRVVPAVKCPAQSCPFFDYCTLESIWLEVAE